MIRCDEHGTSREPPAWWPTEPTFVSPTIFDRMLSMAGHCPVGSHERCFTIAADAEFRAMAANFFGVDRAR